MLQLEAEPYLALTFRFTLQRILYTMRKELQGLNMLNPLILEKMFGLEEVLSFALA